MAPRTRSQGIRPLPLLPIELERKILSFCDPPSLAKACLVSLAFLELASPFLYQDITIQGFKQLSRLFYDENPPSPAPHLDSFLSLSQLRDFSFQDVPEDRYWSDALSTTRIPSFSPLHVQMLDVAYDGFSSFSEPPHDAYTSLFNLFNPDMAVLSSTVNSRTDVPWVSLMDLTWTKIRTLALVAVLPTQFVVEAPFVQALPLNSLTVKLEPFLTPEEPANGEGTSSDLVEEVVGPRRGFGEDRDEAYSLLCCPQVKVVALRTWSFEQAGLLLRTLERVWTEAGISDEETKRRKAMVKFEESEPWITAAMNLLTTTSSSS